MAFRIGSAGPSPFGTGAGATSMISSETGPDLGEINTEVGEPYNAARDPANLSITRLLGFNPSQGRRGFE